MFAHDSLATLHAIHCFPWLWEVNLQELTIHSIIAPHSSLSSEVCDNPNQAMCYHIRGLISEPALGWLQSDKALV